MSDLSPEERERIFQEELARRNAMGDPPAPDFAKKRAAAEQAAKNEGKAEERQNKVGCGLVLLLLVFIGVCSAVSSDGDDTETSPSSKSGLACDHFRNIVSDVRAGVLTDAELRSKLKEVNSNASIASPSVQVAAQNMLAAVTQGRTDQLLVAVGAMDRACSAEGH